MFLRNKALTMLSGIAAASLLASTANASTYNGNGGSGFGGPIGSSILTVTENGSNIDFSLTTGVAFSGNALVIYVDNAAGGVTDTAGLTDSSDPGRTAISGFNSGNPSRTTAFFPAGFDADLAITVEPGVFGGLFSLSNPANFPFVASGGLSGSGSGPFTFSYSKADLGVATPGASFDFVGTLISTSAYRSNETIGTSLTVPGSGGDAPNAGFNGSTTFATADTFTTAPEPATVGILAIAGMSLLARRHRRRLD